MTSRQRKICQALAVASALVAPAAGSASEPSFQELSAQWWQWALSIPTSANPLADSTGANCMVGQRGPIWFLAGSFGGTISRRCSVPQGVPLFFPIVNNVQVNTPHICGQKGPLSVTKMRTNVAPFIDGLKGVAATVDSIAVAGVIRVQSNIFIAALPKDNIFVGPCGGDSPPGIFSPSVDDGYYAKVGPLGVGTHTLQFTAHNDSGFDLNVTYVLDVIAVSLN